MENSIEEDIEYIEALIKIASQLPSGELKIQEKEIEVLNNILSDYKRVLKENEELNLKYYMLYTGKIENLKAQEVKIKSQVIPVQKVKDKIEEIDKKIKYEENEKVVIYLHKQKNILQKLLEGRK